MIRALPQKQYGSFVSSLLLQKDLKKASVQAAFKAEETQRKPRSSPGVSTDSALRASFSASPSSSSKPKVKCDFCERFNHSVTECRSLKAYKEQQKKSRVQQSNQSQQVSPTTPQDRVCWKCKFPFLLPF